MIQHIQLTLPSFPRGFHLITSSIVGRLPELPATGYLKLFLQHTSAGLTINENADPDVRTDFEKVYNQIVPENLPFLDHTAEGPDDMPAHIKASMVGTSLSIPIVGGKLALGIWQGIYLCEFRNNGGRRSLIVSICT